MHVKEGLNYHVIFYTIKLELFLMASVKFYSNEERSIFCSELEVCFE
jgi:hypothetical protein